MEDEWDLSCVNIGEDTWKVQVITPTGAQVDIGCCGRKAAARLFVALHEHSHLSVEEMVNKLYQIIDDDVPEWMRERDKRAAEARRQADREDAPLFAYLWSEDDDAATDTEEEAD